MRKDRTTETAARAHLFAVLRSTAHHIRLAARVLHRKDAAKRDRFHSPVAAHQVAHHAGPPPAAAKS